MNPSADPDFTPAPTRRRVAGWTPARQAAFVAALAGGHDVATAAASVGLTPRSAYQLRRRAGAEDFALAWDAALESGALRLTETAIERAIQGERRPIFYRGRQVGERVTHNDRLLITLLKRRRPLKNGDFA
ncbi:MAG: hypothetical protein JO290_06465 [Sphingomonadaceae bacterium]|nr:hypothetical protein [Sphingomonadaceae bacterium]